MKKTLVVLVFSAIQILAALSFAAEYPTRPIEYIVHAAAGGNGDITARLFAQKSQQLLGQPMVVVNKVGAGGAIGLIAIAKSNPDGHTIGIAGTNLAMAAAVNPDIGYDPVRDFAPICNLITQAVFICVSSESKIKTFAQYIEEAKKNPGKITYGSVGIGGSTYFAGEYLRTVAKADITNVPVREGLVKNLLGGHVESIFVNTPDIVEHVKAGQIRALATTTLQRVPQLPDVPTIAESGYPGFDVVSWIGMVAAPKTPRPIIEKLADFFKKGGQDPQLEAKVKSLGASLTYMGPDEYGNWIKSEYERWLKIAKDLKIQVK